MLESKAVQAKLYDIALIGYGPIGATLANLLGQYGLSVLVLEKDPEIYPLPRAVHFDGEVMRVFESAGLREQVEAISRPGLKGMHFVNAKGETLLIRGGGAQLGPHGCATNYYFHQPDLETVLREGAKRFPSVRLELAQEVVELCEEPDHVVIKTGSNAGQSPTQHWQARYVVGCDGARSIVRKTMGSAMEDLGLHQPWLVFDVVLKHEQSKLSDHTIQHCDPARPMTFCNVTGRRRRWEIMLMPGDDPALMTQEATLWKLVEPWVTPADAHIERAAIYTFHSVIAKQWRKARLLIAGDSAHQTPPFLGQGMCAGIRDASNLAWKLDSVVRQGSSDSLLDSYESERSPHVRAFIDLAVKIGAIIQVTDPVQAELRDQKFLRGAPEVFQYPTPRLGPGMLAGTHESTGQIFPQPQFSDGQWLDQKVGPHFAVLATPEILSEVSEVTRQAWAALGVRVIASQDKTVCAALARHAGAVILRPDRYIYGAAKNAKELDEITQTLLSWNRGIQPNLSHVFIQR